MEAARIPQPRLVEAGPLLAELFDSHGRMVLGICRAILSDPNDAEDAAQQTFLSAHRALVGGTRPRRPAAWLATIARNECRNRIAGRLARPQAIPLADEVAEAPAAGPEEQAARRAEVDALAAGVATLPGRQREAVLLRDFFGLSYREVAAAMSISEPAVESLLSRARRRLEECVGPLHAAQGVLVVPQSLRDELALLVPGFSAADAVAAGAGGGLAGVLAKLVSAPLAGKVAAGLAVGTLVVGGEGAVERTTLGAEPHGRVLLERPADPATGSERVDRAQPTLVQPAEATSRAETEGERDEAPRDEAERGGDNSGRGSTSSGSGSEPDNSGPGSLSSGSGSEGTAAEEPDGSGSGSEVDNSGPGSTSSGSGDGKYAEVPLDNSGPGSTSSGSGSGDGEYAEEPLDD